MEKVKVLYFVDRMLRGGIQTFVLENWKHMDHQKIQIDFLILDDGRDYELEEILRNLGSKVYKLQNIWLRSLKDYIPYYKAVNRFFSVHQEYDAVHLHSASKNFIVLAAAQKYGIKIRIAHSHSIGFATDSKAKIWLGNLLKYPLRYYATDYFACSRMAGRWLFGKKIAEEQLVVVKNAVDVKRFQYDAAVSERMRKQLNLGENLVIGHVGRYTTQKNHIFLIEIFREILHINPNSRLLLVGTGELEETIKRKVFEDGLSEQVIFAGFHSDTYNYMQAMDAFVFPSRFEGLGLVLIEAQAAGLQCFTSEGSVPEEAKATALLQYIPLEEGPAEWAKKIMEYVHLEKPRKTPLEDLRESGYRIEDTAKFLQEFYLERCK